MFLNKIGKSVLIQYLGRVFGYLFSLGTIAILTRSLGVSDYGQYTAVLAIASLAITVSDFGFFWSTINHLGKTEDKTRVLNELSGIKLVLTLAVIAIAGSFVGYGNFSYQVKELYWVLSLFIVTSSLNNVVVAVYQSEYKMLWPTLSEVFSRLIGLLLVAFGAWFKLGLDYFVLSVSVAALLNLSLNWLGLRGLIGRVRIRIFGYKWSIYYRSVFLVGLVQLFYVTFYRSDVVILSWLKPATDVGVYGVVIKVTEILTAVSSIFVASLFPAMVSLQKEGSQAIVSFIRRSLVVSLSVALPVIFIGPFFGREIIQIIAGSEFLTTSTVTYNQTQIYAQTILGIAFVFIGLNFVSVVFYSALLAAQSLKSLLIVNVIVLALNAGLNIALIPHYSYLATASITVLTEVLILLFTGYILFRRVGIVFPAKEFCVLSAFSVAPLGYLAYLGNDHGTILRFGIAALMYFVPAAAYLLKITKQPKIL